MKNANNTLCAAVALLLGACSGPMPERPLPFYRCEYGIEFTAKFVDDSVALNGSRGYEVLYRSSKQASTPASVKANPNPNPNKYSNARMQAEFNLGPTLREAIVRYALLPLVSRCVRDN